MKKFFLFRQEAVGAASIRTSDTGLGLSVFVIPVDKLSFITATEGEIQMVFDDATIYQESALYTGEAIEKTAVLVACKVGEEVRAIDDIMKFMSSDSSANRFMRFDGATGGYSSKYVDTTSPQTVVPKVKPNPINVQTSKRSFGDADAIAANTVAGINFNYTQPFIDYSHDGINGLSDGQEIAHSSHVWQNGGTGGTTYDITSNEGTPTCVDPDVRDFGLSFKGAFFNEGDYFYVPTAKFADDYTAYIVISNQYVQNKTYTRTVDQVSPLTSDKIIFSDTNTAAGAAIGDRVYNSAGEDYGVITALNPDGDNTREIRVSATVDIINGEVMTFKRTPLFNQYFSVVYGDEAGEAIGPGSRVYDSGAAGKLYLTKDIFSIRHSGVTDVPLEIKADGPIYGDTSETDYDPCHVFIIRRDEKNRIFIHDRTGRIVAESPAIKAGSGNTTGKLKVERLGTTADIVLNNLSKVVLGRFGVIPQDIGYNESVRLADDLYQLYSTK